jgi:hypothetical protein
MAGRPPAESDGGMRTGWTLPTALGFALLFTPSLGRAAPSSSPPSAGFPVDDPPLPQPSSATPSPTGPASVAPDAAPADAPPPRASAPAPASPADEGNAKDTKLPRKPEFGDEGQFAITEAFQLSIGANDPGPPNVFAVVFQPSIHYFVIPELSLGLTLLVEHDAKSESYSTGFVSGTTDVKETTYGVGIDIGANARLSHLVSIWIRGLLGVDYEHSVTTAPPSLFGGNITENDSEFFVGLYAPVLIHPVSHFFLGFGPQLRFAKGLSSGGSGFNVGATSTVGGWI